MQTHQIDEKMAAAPDIFVGNLWSNHPDYPGYLFGIDGRVASIARNPLVMRPVKRGSYKGLFLRDPNGRRRGVYLHRLIAEAFHGPCPDGMECRHLDGDKDNNSATNLCWGTHAENLRDTVLHGTSLVGERNPQAKLTSEAVTAMRDMRAATGKSYKLIAKAFGVSTMTAYRAVVGQSWK